MIKNNYVFCCDNFDHMIRNSDNLYNVKYDAVIREFFIKSISGPYIRTIDYCPWCGSKFPISLRNEWYDYIRDNLKLEPNDPDDREKIPTEFLTDEWWKKRGL